MSLNIDHGAILDRAQKRSELLRNLEALLAPNIQNYVNQLKEQERWLTDLDAIMDQLDPEGKAQVPDVIKTGINALAYYEYIVNKGLEPAAALFPHTPHLDALLKEHEWVPEPMHPYDPEADPAKPKIATMLPDRNGPVYHDLSITFLPDWDNQHWPQGAWQARYEGEVNYGIGRTPDEAFRDLHQQDLGPR